MLKNIRLKITLTFVLVVLITELCAGIFVTIRSIIGYHDMFDSLISETLNTDMRKALTDTANAVMVQPAPDGGDSVILSEPGAENAENLKNMLFSSQIFKHTPGMILAILDSEGTPMYSNDQDDLYKNSRTAETILQRVINVCFASSLIIIST